MQDAPYVHAAFSEIADKYVVTNHVLSGGIDFLWRAKAARLAGEKLDPNVENQGKGLRILDLATGSGDLLVAMKKRLPAAESHGSDFCEPMLNHARKRGLENLCVADAMDLPYEKAHFDLVTVGFGLRNMADYGVALREMRRVLKPGGWLLILDFSLPKSAIVRSFYRAYLHHLLPRVAGWITGKREAYEYLGGSIEKFPSGHAMMELIADQGFDSLEWKPLTMGVSSIYLARAGGEHLEPE